MDEGGGGPPRQAHASGGGPRLVGVATGVAWAEMGGAPPPLEKGVKMFELAQLNLLSPEKKKAGGGQPLANHRHVLVGAGTRADGVCGEDLDLDADLVSADGGGGGSPRRRPTGVRMPDWCTASPAGPSPSPSPQPPQLGVPRSRNPPTPGTPSPRPWGPSPPSWTGTARYVDCVLALI